MVSGRIKTSENEEEEEATPPSSITVVTTATTPTSTKRKETSTGVVGRVSLFVKWLVLLVWSCLHWSGNSSYEKKTKKQTGRMSYKLQPSRQYGSSKRKGDSREFGGGEGDGDGDEEETYRSSGGIERVETSHRKKMKSREPSTIAAGGEEEKGETLVELKRQLWETKQKVASLETENSRLKEELHDQIRAGKVLEESEARFRIMADAAPVLIWVSNTSKGNDVFQFVFQRQYTDGVVLWSIPQSASISIVRG